MAAQISFDQLDKDQIKSVSLSLFPQFSFSLIFSCFLILVSRFSAKLQQAIGDLLHGLHFWLHIEIGEGFGRSMLDELHGEVSEDEPANQSAIPRFVFNWSQEKRYWRECLRWLKEYLDNIEYRETVNKFRYNNHRLQPQLIKVSLTLQIT